jgi:hypothetical protein
MSSMWRSRLFWRLFLSFAVFGLALIGFPAAVLLQQAAQHDTDQWEGAARARARLLRDAVRGLPAEQALELEKRLQEGQGNDRARVTCRNRAGQATPGSMKERSWARMLQHRYWTYDEWPCAA